MNSITVTSKVRVPAVQAWQYWTLPEHITRWNFASPDWYCPQAENNLVEGGEFHYLMAAKDGSVSFDFWGTYRHIEPGKRLEIVLGDGRKMSVSFDNPDGSTVVTETFEPEGINPPELQQAGWQAILDNFSQHAEEQYNLG